MKIWTDVKWEDIEIGDVLRSNKSQVFLVTYKEDDVVGGWRHPLGRYWYNISLNVKRENKYQRQEEE